MQKMMIIKGHDEGMEFDFIQFSLSSENIDGIMALYTTVICKDENGELEEFPISHVRFI